MSIALRALCVAAVLVVGLVAPGARADQLVPGYAARLAGEVFEYHSPDVEVTKALLVRSLDGRVIEWETAPAPLPSTAEDGGVQFVSFVWMFGLQVNPAGHTFEL